MKEILTSLTLMNYLKFNWLMSQESWSTTQNKEKMYRIKQSNVISYKINQLTFWLKINSSINYLRMYKIKLSSTWSSRKFTRKCSKVTWIFRAPKIDFKTSSQKSNSKTNLRLISWSNSKSHHSKWLRPWSTISWIWLSLRIKSLSLMKNILVCTRHYMRPFKWTFSQSIEVV